jgi:hypothetical protein
MTRLVPGIAAGALVLGISVAAGGPAEAGQLKTCSDYVKARNVSCAKAGYVAEKGLATLLDQNSTVARFEGWTCKRRSTEDRKFRCVKKANGTTMLVKYSST